VLQHLFRVQLAAISVKQNCPPPIEVTAEAKLNEDDALAQSKKGKKPMRPLCAAPAAWAAASDALRMKTARVGT
jgi:hypothetical protein